MHPIVALAGRRIDAPGAEPRFPPARVPEVSARLRTLFLELRPAALVCSAACGADLVALEVAGELGVRRRIVLPFAADKFRETSVVDRPGPWGEIYDRVVEDARALGDLVVLTGAAPDRDAYLAGSETILDQAVMLASAQGAEGRVVAVLVWEGGRRADGDLSGPFADSARRRGMSLREVLSIAGASGTF